MKKSLFKNNQKYFHINMDFETHPLFKNLDWVFLQKTIQLLINDFGIQVHALVMMDTHIHLLIQSDRQQENYFNAALKKTINLKNDSDKDLFCEPITEYAQYLNAYKYIYRNPVEAGLVEHAENYLFSSLANLLGKSVSYCEVIDHLALIQNPIQVIKWLNNQTSFRYSKLSEVQSFKNLH